MRYLHTEDEDGIVHPFDELLDTHMGMGPADGPDKAQNDTGGFYAGSHIYVEGNVDQATASITYANAAATQQLALAIDKQQVPVLL